MTDYPRVTGTDRDDDLLSLEEAAMPRRRLMIGMAECLWQAVLVGNPAPVVRRMSERMQHPVPGDLVTAQHYVKQDGYEVHALGILLARRREHYGTDEERAAEGAEWGDAALDSRGERPAQETWYVQYGPAAGDVCRWENVSFIMVPSERGEFDVPIGTRTPSGGVSLTRGDLLSGLADSGFRLRLPEGPG